MKINIISASFEEIKEMVKYWEEKNKSISFDWAELNIVVEELQQ